MRTPVVLLVTAAVLSGCSSLTPTNDPVYLRITDIEARLIRIERVLENESLVALAGEITALREEVRSLLGEVETLGFELDSQAERQQALYADLDQRLSALEAARDRLASMPSGAAGGAAVAGQTDEEAYNSALALVQRDLDAAQAAFQRFLMSYPQSSWRSHAQYWLAETYYAQLDFATALTEFEKVLSDYPEAPKRPDALVKIGFCHHELDNLDRARQALLRVMQEFPNTDQANTADQRLRQIAAETG